MLVVMTTAIGFVTTAPGAAERAAQPDPIAAPGEHSRLPVTCRLEIPAQDRPANAEAAENVAKAWARALDVAVTMRRQVVRARGSGSAGTDAHRRARETKAALLHSRIVPHQQQIFIALGADGHALATRLSKRLDGCITAIRENL